MTSEGGRFFNLMEKQAKTLGGIFSNFQDQLFLIAKRLGDRGLLKEIKKLLDAVISFVRTNEEQIIEFLLGAIRGMIELTKGLAASFILMIRIFRVFAKTVGGVERTMIFLARAISLIVGLKFAFHIGNMVQGMVGLILVTQKAGTAMLLLQAKMLLIPLAISAILISLALIAEDIIGFTEGKQSVIGVLIAAFTKLSEIIDEKLFKGTKLGFLETTFKGIRDTVQDIAIAFDKTADSGERLVRGARLFKTLFSGGGLTPQGLFSGLLQSAAASTTLDPTPGLVGFTGVAAGTAGGKNVTNVQMDVKIDANNLSAPEAQDVIQGALAGAMSNMMRESARNVDPIIER